MGRRLPDEVVYRIRLRVKANKSIVAIKLQLNLDIWGEPYTPPTVTLAQYRSLLPYQEIVIYNVMALSLLLTYYAEAS